MKNSKGIIAPTDFFQTPHKKQSTKKFPHPHANMPIGDMKSFDQKNVLKRNSRKSSHLHALITALLSPLVSTYHNHTPIPMILCPGSRLHVPISTLLFPCAHPHVTVLHATVSISYPHNIFHWLPSPHSQPHSPNVSH